jgi:hypothetical protein
MLHNIESVLVVATAVGLFLLALFCLACSLSGGEVLLNCSTLRKSCRSCCCCCCHKQSDDADDENDNGEQQRRQQQPKPPSYENVNEFIFQSDNDPSTVGILTLNNGNETPTTMQQLFPDLLGGNSPDGQDRKMGFFSSPSFRRTTSDASRAGGRTKRNGEHKKKNGGNGNINTIRQTTNAELQEPLL